MDFWCIYFVVFGNGCTSKGIIAVVNCLEVLWNANGFESVAMLLNNALIQLLYM